MSPASCKRRARDAMQATLAPLKALGKERKNLSPQEANLADAAMIKRRVENRWSVLCARNSRQSFQKYPKLQTASTS